MYIPIQSFTHTHWNHTYTDFPLHLVLGPLSLPPKTCTHTHTCMQAIAHALSFMPKVLNESAWCLPWAEGNQAARDPAWTACQVPVATPPQHCTHTHTHTIHNFIHIPCCYSPTVLFCPSLRFTCTKLKQAVEFLTAQFNVHCIYRGKWGVGGGVMNEQGTLHVLYAFSHGHFGSLYPTKANCHRPVTAAASGLVNPYFLSRDEMQDDLFPVRKKSMPSASVAPGDVTSTFTQSPSCCREIKEAKCTCTFTSYTNTEISFHRGGFFKRTISGCLLFPTSSFLHNYVQLLTAKFRCINMEKQPETNTGTISKAMLEKLLRDTVEHIWAFPSA